jgi:hypothetical protein
MMTRLTYLALMASVASVLVSAMPSRGSSPGERALFGYSYSEDCLFGTTSHLYGPMPAPVAVPVDPMATVPASSTTTTTSSTTDEGNAHKEQPRKVAFLNAPQTPFGV